MIDTRSEPIDAALVRLIDSSVPFRLISGAGDQMVVAWKSSALTAVVAAWRAAAIDRRVRLVSVVVMVAVLTHVMLTGFSAPAPTWWARAVWIAMILTSLAVGLCARGVAAAWTQWTVRRTSHERGRL